MPQVRIGEYLLRRVRELGVKSVFGVPGDYELALLDLVPDCGLSWKGNANELVAAYAADGYARVNGIGCLITTFGPGELSALNAIGGSYAESLPIIHIVGYPAMQAINGKMVIHHTLGVPNYTSYHEISKHLSCATTVLTDPAIATAEIDRVLEAMIYHSKPCYIGIPGDIGNTFIEEVDVPKSLTIELPKPDPLEEKKAIEAISKTLATVKKPLAVVDAGTLRARAVDELMVFLEKFKIPFIETSMSKGALNEKHQLFGGHYPGMGTSMETRKLVENSDCLLWFGPFLNDLNTPRVTEDFKGKAVTLIHRTHLQIGSQTYQINMKALLAALTVLSDGSLLPDAVSRKVPEKPFPEITPPEGDIIGSDWLFSYVTHFFQPGDVLVTETGTAGINIRRAYLPDKTTHLTQKLWGSIGFASGACLGAFIAANEEGAPRYKRNILFTGDGSFQMTAQVFGDLIRYRTNGYIFIINNDGYAIERAIHGATASYNDIAPWDYSLLTKFFDSTGTHPTKTYQIRTPQELHQLLVEDKEFQIPDKLRVIEIFTGKFDYGYVLDVVGPIGDKFNLGLPISWDEPKAKAETNGKVNGATNGLNGVHGKEKELHGMEHTIGG